MDKPKISFILGVNGLAMSGLEGQYKTSTQIYDRLNHETKINPGIKIEKKQTLITSKC
ncbi:hypothetical protein ERUR111494_04090 [Erysipelothrix urinaevulpis]|uniref:hypothetical protein n=1 Tax=Erysipelothrix urinaevulpis TaxID=2683717 RepID=UPI0013574C40|nr:hypothetical protein [Erysipelothrix urinaevulpis]